MPGHQDPNNQTIANHQPQPTTPQHGHLGGSICSLTTITSSRAPNKQHPMLTHVIGLWGVTHKTEDDEHKVNLSVTAFELCTS